MTGTSHIPDGLAAPADAHFALLATRFHADIVDALLDGAEQALRAHGVPGARIHVLRVPGAWELPLAADQLAAAGYAAVVALGCVIRGDTRHYEQVADECARGLMRVQLDRGVCVANAVLAVEQRADALARAGGAHGNKGAEAALAALEMAALQVAVPERASPHGTAPGAGAVAPGRERAA